MSYIHGPAIIKFGSQSFYFKDGLNVQITTETEATASDIHGKLGDVVKSRVTKISGTPVGLARAMSVLFPHQAGIGATILTGALEIWTKAGLKITWARAGVSKSPTMLLRPTAQIFNGALEFTCLGKADEAATEAGHWQAEAATAFSDTTFTEALLMHARYTAAYGATPAAPFDAITASEGFEVAVDVETENVMDDNVGIVDIALKSVSASCKFKPSNLTEAEMKELILLEGATALQPGMFVGQSGEPLVITGTAGGSTLTVTLADCGFSNAAFLYQTGKLRGGEVMAMTRRTFTTGSPDNLFTFAVS